MTMFKLYTGPQLIQPRRYEMFLGMCGREIWAMYQAVDRNIKDATRFICKLRLCVKGSTNSEILLRALALWYCKKVKISEPAVALSAFDMNKVARIEGEWWRISQAENNIFTNLTNIVTVYPGLRLQRRTRVVTLWDPLLRCLHKFMINKVLVARLTCLKTDAWLYTVV